MARTDWQFIWLPIGGVVAAGLGLYAEYGFRRLMVVIADHIRQSPKPREGIRFAFRAKDDLDPTQPYPPAVTRLLNPSLPASAMVFALVTILATSAQEAGTLVGYWQAVLFIGILLPIPLAMPLVHSSQDVVTSLVRGTSVFALCGILITIGYFARGWAIQIGTESEKIRSWVILTECLAAEGGVGDGNENSQEPVIQCTLVPEEQTEDAADDG